MLAHGVPNASKIRNKLFLGVEKTGAHSMD